MEKVFLWKDKAPYSDESPDQAQPSVAPYPVNSSKGAVVVCAGGAYGWKSDHEAWPVAEMINEAGVSAFVLDYRVKPCHFMAPLADANRAIRVVRSLGYEKVGILGFSAGGNLCCAAATHYDAGDPESEDEIERLSSRPDAFIPCYAVSSFVSYTTPGTVRNLLADRQNDPELLRFFSAELNVTKDTPPAYIWHTVNDGSVPVESSLALARALSDKGVSYEMHLFPEGSHGLGLAQGDPSVSRWAGELKAWLLREGFGK